MIEITTTTQTVIIRADASSTIGLGHVIRCLTLQRALKHQRVKCIFVYKELPDSLRNQIVDEGAELAPLTTNDPSADCDEILAMQQVFSAVAILVDSYAYGTEAFSRLATGDMPLIVMDDLNDRGPLHAAMVINSLHHADRLGYEDTAPNAVKLLGLDYVLLREEFQHFAATPLRASMRPRLLVNFGGSDVLGLSLPTMHALLSLDPKLPVTLITGSGFPNPAQAEAVANRHENVEHLHSCTEMAKQFHRTGLAVAAPGSTIYELAACGVPSILLTSAENQRLSADAHAKFGWCHVYDGRDPAEVARAAAHAAKLWKNPEQRDTLQLKTADLVDGNGAMRVAERMMALVKLRSSVI